MLVAVDAQLARLLALFQVVLPPPYRSQIDPDRFSETSGDGHQARRRELIELFAREVSGNAYPDPLRAVTDQAVSAVMNQDEEEIWDWLGPKALGLLDTLEALTPRSRNR